MPRLSGEFLGILDTTAAASNSGTYTSFEITELLGGLPWDNCGKELLGQILHQDPGAIADGALRT